MKWGRGGFRRVKSHKTGKGPASPSEKAMGRVSEELRDIVALGFPLYGSQAAKDAFHARLTAELEESVA